MIDPDAFATEILTALFGAECVPANAQARRIALCAVFVRGEAMLRGYERDGDTERASYLRTFLCSVQIDEHGEVVAFTAMDN